MEISPKRYTRSIYQTVALKKKYIISEFKTFLFAFVAEKWSSVVTSGLIQKCLDPRQCFVLVRSAPSLCVRETERQKTEE